MKYINYDDITGVHLEITTKCNAACPMCARNFKGKQRDNLELIELSLEDCKTIFKKEFLLKIKFISICGVYGDPINATELIEIIDYIYSCNPDIYINLYTNGGKNSILWWQCLAKTLKNGCVIFGIDGIGKTHSIYRRNTDFNTVIRNATAFINHGGIAKWDYLAFKHNEHQIEAAKELSKALGFASFQVKKTSRFLKNLYEEDSALDSTIMGYGKHPIYNAKGSLEGVLELPLNKKYRNSTENDVFEIIERYGSLQHYFDNVGIDCQAIKTRGIFVSAKGEIFPCCTIYQQICYASIYGVQDDTETNEFKLYQKNNNISAKYQSIKQIVQGDFFKSIQEGWNLSCIKAGKPKSCARACGIKFDMHSGQHK